MASKALSKKVRRNSGRIIVQDDEGYSVYWDDWIDWRDGMRDKYGSDKSRIVRTHEARQNQNPPTEHYYSNRKFFTYVDDDFKKMHKNNEKLKRLLKRREAMKDKRK